MSESSEQPLTTSTKPIAAGYLNAINKQAETNTTKPSATTPPLSPKPISPEAFTTGSAPWGEDIVLGPRSSPVNGYDAVFNQLRDLSLPVPTAEIATRVAAEELSVENLHALTSIENSIDMAQKHSESYFSENVIYFLDDNLRKNVVGMKDKPNLNAQRLAMFKVKEDRDWYVNIGKPWLALALSGPKFKVNVDLLNADLSLQFQNFNYTRQVTLLYHYSYVEQVPQIKAYINDGAKKWLDLYKTYLLGEIQDNWESFVKVSPPSIVQTTLKQITSKLDLLDPTGDTGREVGFKLSIRVYINQVLENYDDIKNSKPFRDTLYQAVEEFRQAKRDTEEYEGFTKLLEAAGGSAQLASALLGAFQSIPKTEITESVEVTGGNIIKRYLNQFSRSIRNVFTKPGALNLFKRMLGSFLLFTSVGAIAISFSQFDNINTVEKVATFFNAAGILLSLMTSFEWVDKKLSAVAFALGSWFYNYIRPKVSASILNGINKSVTYLFGTKTVSKFLESRILPILILVNTGFIIRDAIHDLEEKNYGAFSLDILAVVFAFGEAYFLWFLSATWSGPIGATILAIFGLIALGIKLIFFPEKTPAEKYHDQLNRKYTRTDIKVTSNQDLSQATYLRAPDGRYVWPKDSQTLELVKWIPHVNTFKLYRVNQNQVLLYNPLNTLSSPLGSFMSCRGNKLSWFTATNAPTNENETFTLLDTGKQNTYNLMAYNGKFINVNGKGELELNDNSRTAFEFIQLPGFFDPSLSNSLISGYKLPVGQMITNGKLALAVVQANAYVIKLPTIITNPPPTIEQMIHDDPNCIEYEMFINITGGSIGPNGYLYLTDKGEPQLFNSDGQQTGKHRLTAFSRSDMKAPYALTIANDPMEDYVIFVEDINFVGRYSDN